MNWRIAAASLPLALALATPLPPSTQHVPFIETFHRHGKTLVYVTATHHSRVQYP